MMLSWKTTWTPYSRGVTRSARRRVRQSVPVHAQPWQLCGRYVARYYSTPLDNEPLPKSSLSGKSSTVVWQGILMLILILRSPCFGQIQRNWGAAVKRLRTHSSLPKQGAHPRPGACCTFSRPLSQTRSFGQNSKWRQSDRIRFASFARTYNG